MLVKVVLIIDKRKEQSIKYKKMIETADTSVFVATNLADALDLLNSFEPDLILISDSIEENVQAIIKKLRILSYTTRPVIIALSKSDHLQDRIETLNAGSDDYLSEPIENEEFKARIGAHIRRHIESNINEITGLYDSKVSYKILRRTIKKEGFWAVLLVGIDNFDFYREIYGELAADKMLQTYTAILTSGLDSSDYMGQIGECDFMIITHPMKAEKLASYLTYAFDTVVNKFYSDKDVERGYIIMQGDEKLGNKVSFVSTSIGIVSNQHKTYSNFRQVLSSLINMHKLAKYKQGSAFVMERPKISALDSVEEQEFNNKILIVEPDEALSVLLLATAQIQGYDAKVINNYSEIFNLDSDFTPSVIILDAGNTMDLEGIELCDKIKDDIRFLNSNIILSSTVHDKQKVLNAGADLYLPKPYELSVMFSWIEKFVRDYNN